MVTWMKPRAGAVVVAMIFGPLIGAHPIPAADSPVGKWSPVDDKTGKVTSEVEVHEQSGKLYGKIIGRPPAT